METTINLLKTLLQNKLTGVIKSFYIGDPILLPESAMPCISISPNKSDITIADNQRDNREHTIDVALIVDARQFFNATPDKMVGTTFLMEIMAKENADTTINSNTILGVIRENLNLSTNRFIMDISTIDYTTRRRTEDLVTLEAVATVVVQQLSNRT